MLARTGLTETFVDGVTVHSGAERGFVHKWIETQGIGALMALGNGTKSGFEVTDGGGLNVSISAGSGVALDTTLGAVALYKSTSTTLAISASSTKYVFGTIEDSGSNVSQTSGLPLFLADDSASRDGAILLAKVITGVASITSITDMRVLLDSDSLNLFGNDEANTDGLDWAFTAGRIRQSDGTIVEVNADVVTITEGPINYVQVDDAGVVTANTSGFDSDQKPIAEITADDGNITSYLDKRVSFDFGAGGSGSVTEITSTDNSIDITDGTGPTADLSLADDAATDAKIGNRTADPSLVSPASTGTLTQLFSWITGRIKAITGETNWYDAPDTTLALAATHIAASDPHAGVLPLDGTRAMTGDLNAGGNLITNLDTPVSGTDAVNKTYADALAAGIRLKESVAAATTANITLSAPQTIDGVAVIAGDRVLVKNQSTGANNGIYIVAAGSWTRATDADADAEMTAGSTVFVQNGVVNEKTRWTLITESVVVGTTVQVWTQETGNGTGEANTTSNAGSGTGTLAKAKAGIDLPIKTLTEGDGITITNGANEVTLAVDASGFDLDDVGGTLGKAKGGTGVDLSATGGAVNTTGKKVLVQGADNVIGARAIIAADLPLSGVTAGTYSSANIVVDDYGRVTSASSSVGGGSVTASGTATLTNKRITPRIFSEASNATPTPDSDAYDQHNITALAAGAAFAAPTGTPTDGQKLILRIVDNGTTRALSFNAIYRVVGTTLPTATTANKTIYIGLIYNSAATKWDVVAVNSQV